MNIAYLLLGYNQEHHIARMIRLLEDEHAVFFLHIDRKSDIRPFLRAIQSPRVVFLENRLPIHWGGWNMVQATLNLLQAAVAYPLDFHYYQLLSDSCFPIKPRQYIYENLMHSDRNFLFVKEMINDESSYWFRVRLYHLPDHFVLRPRHYWTHYGFNARNPLYRLCRKLVGLLLPRAGYHGLPSYKGSQWWCLTHACVSYILHFVHEHPGFVRFYKFTHIPDEMFFHTIIQNSPFARTVPPVMNAGHFEGNHYIIFEAGAPMFLTEAHLPDLLASGACFARKFHETVSAPLLNRLEQVCNESPLLFNKASLESRRCLNGDKLRPPLSPPS